MDRLPTPTITPLAERWLQSRDSRLSEAQLALLRMIDGLRNIIELESLARNLGLGRNELEMLLRAGLLTYDIPDAVNAMGGEGPPQAGHRITGSSPTPVPQQGVDRAGIKRDM